MRLQLNYERGPPNHTPWHISFSMGNETQSFEVSVCSSFLFNLNIILIYFFFVFLLQYSSAAFSSTKWKLFLEVVSGLWFWFSCDLCGWHHLALGLVFWPTDVIACPPLIGIPFVFFCFTLYLFLYAGHAIYMHGLTSLSVQYIFFSPAFFNNIFKCHGIYYHTLPYFFLFFFALTLL